MTREQILAELEPGWHLVPERLRPGLERYFADRVRPGGFLCAVLANDLREATGRADDEHLPHLRNLVRFLYNYAPAKSHGSAEAVEAWLAPDPVS